MSDRVWGVSWLLHPQYGNNLEFCAFIMFYRNVCNKIKGGILLKKTHQHQALYSPWHYLSLCAFIFAGVVIP